MQQQQQIAIFGGGCFWCIEAIFQKVKGVSQVISGYTGGHVENPTYQNVKKQLTGHIEVIKILFDPKTISYDQLLQVFMNVHDPTQSDGQGQDVGSQYLSSIFYTNEFQKESAENSIKATQLKIDGENGQKKVCTLVRKLQKFYQAQNYHQNYYNQRGSSNPYCNIIPGKIAKFKKLFKQYSKSQ